MKVTLRVTAKHIEDGVRASCQDCPVALALGDLLDKRYGAHVASDRLRIMSDRLLWSALAPDAVRDFIHRFDYPGDERVSHEPFECDLDIPKELLR